MTNTPVLYTVKDVMEIFKCSDKKAYELMHTPGFPSFTVDKRIYVEQGALNRWIDKQRCEHFSTGGTGKRRGRPPKKSAC